MNRLNGTVLLAIALWLNSAVAPAQQPGEAPRLILNAGGASQPIRSLRFSPDSTRLYAAGDHKCVHVWRIPAQPLPPSLETSLQWGISRANIGRIYAMDLSPTGTQLVVGGYSIRSQGGDLALFDLPAHQFNKPLPAADRTIQNQAATGHLFRVNGASFSLDGQRLATIGVKGDILVWSTAAGTIVNRLAESAALEVIDASRQLPVLYLANGTVVGPTIKAPVTNPPVWSLTAFQTGKPARNLLPDAGELVTLARDPAGLQWASLHQVEPHVRVWDQTGQVTRTIRSTRPDSQPSGLAFGPGNLLLVAERQFVRAAGQVDYFNQTGPTWLQLWDTSPAEPTLLDEVQVSNSPTPICCAFSPDGRWIASASGDGEDVNLHPLLDAQNARVAQPLSAIEPVVLHGRGMPFWKVAFEETASGNGDYRIGISSDRKQNITFNDYGNISREFDLVASKLIPQSNPASRWRTPTSGVAGWSVALTNGPDRGLRLQLLNNGAVAGVISFDQDNQGHCISYCWLPAAAGRPLALAVGMSGESGGIFVYELTNPAQPRLVRYFRDHQHWVTSLSVSRDGKYLASASRDQMIKIWSLAALFDHPARFSNACAWGAEFVAQGNQLTVQNVQPAGIIAGRGLRNGDVITAVDQKPVTNPQQVASELNGQKLWKTVGLDSSGIRDGKAIKFEPFAITPAWEPLLSLFVDRNQEWAAWTPRGFYEASAEGDKLFGWLINRERAKAPLFFRSDQLRQEMERPDVIRSLLLAGNHDTALRAGGEAARVTDTNPVRNIAVNKMPEIEIISPANKAHFAAGQAITLEARGVFPSAVALDSFQPQAYLNKVPLPPPVVEPGQGQVRYTWQLQPTGRDNNVQVKLTGTGERASAHYVEDQISFTADIEPPRRRMFFLGISAQEYPTRAYRSLKHTHADIEALKSSLEVRQGVHYDLAAEDISILQDHKITAEAITSEMEGLKSRIAARGAVGANDLLVIAISGHGDRVEWEEQVNGKSKKVTEYFFIAPHPEIKRFGDDPNAVKERGVQIRQYGIAWKLLERLADVPCMRLFLLDTCHSGAVKESQTTQNAQRALDRTEAFVMTSAAAHERSWEGGKLKQGVFTYCLLEGLNGLADGADPTAGKQLRDQDVDLLELAEYVKRRAPREAEDLAGIPQHPNFIPGSVDAVFRIPLVRIQNPQTSAVSP